MIRTSASVTQLAKILWDYLRLNTVLKSSELIIAMGCEDIRVAERAAELYEKGYGKYVVCTGKSGARTKMVLLKHDFPTEAAWFANTIVAAGVPSEFVLVEDRSTNSGKNIKFVQQLIAQKDIEVEQITVVTAPYAERRQALTYQAQWPQQMIQITSPQINFDTYVTDSLNITYLINALVGRVQRIKLYDQLGYQSSAEIPAEAINAYEHLISLGFTDQLVD